MSTVDRDASIQKDQERIAALEDQVDWWHGHAEQLDKNWEAVHEAAMRPIRAALGLPDGTVPELLAEIERLEAERDTAIEALRSIANFRVGPLPGVDPHVQAARFAWRVAIQALGAIDGPASPTVAAAIRAKRPPYDRPEFRLDPDEG